MGFEIAWRVVVLASEAEVRLQKLKQAGSKSWAAVSAALEESRKAFDRANQALKRATAH